MGENGGENTGPFFADSPGGHVSPLESETAT